MFKLTIENGFTKLVETATSRIVFNYDSRTVFFNTLVNNTVIAFYTVTNGVNNGTLNPFYKLSDLVDVNDSVFTLTSLQMFISDSHSTGTAQVQTDFTETDINKVSFLKNKEAVITSDLNVANQNVKITKTWLGDLAEYNLISSSDISDETIYNISDFGIKIGANTLIENSNKLSVQASTENTINVLSTTNLLIITGAQTGNKTLNLPAVTSDSDGNYLVVYNLSTATYQGVGDFILNNGNDSQLNIKPSEIVKLTTYNSKSYVSYELTTSIKEQIEVELFKQVNTEIVTARSLNSASSIPFNEIIKNEGVTFANKVIKANSVYSFNVCVQTTHIMQGDANLIIALTINNVVIGETRLQKGTLKGCNTLFFNSGVSDVTGVKAHAYVETESLLNISVTVYPIYIEIKRLK